LFRGVRLRAPRHHDSDHRSVILTVRGGKRHRLRRYRQRRQRLPLKLPKQVPHTELETAFETLKEACEVPEPRQRPTNSWISDGTWELVDRRAALRKRGQLFKSEERRLARRIAALLKEDWKQRAALAAEDIETHLSSGDLKEAWRCVKLWHRQASEIASKPSLLLLERQTVEREN